MAIPTTVDNSPVTSAFAGVSATALGAALQQIMAADDLKPGDEVSYSIAKSLWLYHPLGNCIASKPIELAQSQDREISIPDAPDEVVEAFVGERERIGADQIILNVNTQARVYGLASVGMGTEKKNSADPIDLKDLWKSDTFFNVFDPLNTSGLIVDQDPNSPTFQKHSDLRVNGQLWHRSRTSTVLNEDSVYIAWTTSAFSYAGRSAYQRALYPLKSFLLSMQVDDMVLRKAGLLVAKMEAGSSIVDRVMQSLFAVKRALLKQARTDNVLSIGTQEAIETLNLNNIDGAVQICRNDVIKNIAVGVDMPAKMLTQEAYVEGFGEGTEDARAVAQWVDRLRIKMAPIYGWFDNICQHRAWSPELYDALTRKYSDTIGNMSFEQAFYQWKNNFRAIWPNLIKEPESALTAVDDVRLKGVIATFQVLSPAIAAVPEAMMALLAWVEDQLNTHEHLFQGAKLTLPLEEIRDTLAQQAEQQMAQTEMGTRSAEAQLAQMERAHPAPAFSGRDSAASVARLADLTLRKQHMKGRAVQ